MSERNAADVSRRVVWMALVLFTLMTTAGLALFCEWEHYRRLLHWQRLELPLRDQAALFWVLWAKSLAVLAPFLLVAGFLAWRGRSRMAWAWYGTASALVLAWLVVDLRVQRITGNHLLAYLEFAGTPAAMEWAGGGGLALPLGLWAGLALLAAAATGCACHHVARWLVTRSWMEGTRGWSLVTAGFLVAMLGSVPAQWWFAEPRLLEQLYAALPSSALVSLSHQRANTPRSLGRSPLLATAGVSGPVKFHQFRQRMDNDLTAALQELWPVVMETPPPCDDQVRVEGPDLPNVVILVLESLRHTAVNPESMPRLHAWSGSGLRCQRHYAGSNRSEYGIFALVHSRHPVMYDATLDSGIRPQMCRAFHNSGYRCSFTTSGTINWNKMDLFVNAPMFDQVLVELDGDFPSRDRKVLGHVERILQTSRGRPQLVVAFLMSTHFGYFYPPEFERFTPTCTLASSLSGLNPAQHRAKLSNRYRNACLFLDTEIGKVLATLDPKRNLVVVTGDHGESIFDDGYLAHASRLSEFQTRVPMTIAGPGVEPGVVERLTQHIDLLPTLLHVLARRPVPIQRCLGKDILDTSSPRQEMLLFHRYQTNQDW